MCYNKNMDDTLNDNPTQDINAANQPIDPSLDSSTDSGVVVSDTVDINAPASPVDAVVNEVEGRAQEDLLAQELSAVKGITPKEIGAVEEHHIAPANPVDFGSSNEPELLVAMRIYEALGMPDPEALALGAIYEKMDHSMTEEQKKARLEYIKTEYQNWKTNNQ